jgi:hypothetical protein
MTKITGKRDHRPALVAALTLLGASLGISTPSGAASDTTGLFLKGHDTTTSKQIKGETTSTQHKFWNPNATQIKGETTSSQHKGTAPSAMFLKHNVAPVSNQIKGETHSHQIKGETHSTQIKLDPPDRSH